MIRGGGESRVECPLTRSYDGRIAEELTGQKPLISMGSLS